MKPQLSKIKTYIGFAVRSRQIIYGVDDILKHNFKGLVLMSNALAESSANKLKSHISYAGGQVLSFEPEEFAELFGDKNVKAAAIKDNNLAVAIKKNMTN
jgi:hypothetical protein